MINACSSPALAAILKVAKNIMNLFGIIAPILLLVMASINLIRLMKDPDDKKGLPRLRNSALAAVMIFFVPIFVNAVMYMLDDSFTVTACWNSANYSYSTTYVDPYGKEKSKFYNDPSDYEKGSPKPTPSASSPTSPTSTYDPTQHIDGTAQRVGDVVWDPNDVTKISNLTTAQLVAILNKHGGKATDEKW